MRRARYPRHHLISAAAVACCLTIGAAPSASAVDDPVSLPTVRTALGADEPCAGPSAETARAEPWTRAAMSLSRAWQLTQGSGVLVAVVDTGVGADIPALQGRVTHVGAAKPDCVGHGSFAAGLIAAAPGPGSGMAGVAPQARVLAVPGTDERGITDGPALATAIRQAADAGAKVIYVARAVLDGRAELTKAVEYASERDALIVAPVAPDALPRGATGDQAAARPYFPAFLPKVVSVVDYGPDLARPTNAPEPFAADLAAPGDAVVSVGPRGAGHYIGSGSSFAAANVAGAAALVRARYPELSADQTAARLASTAYPADIPRLDPYAGLTAVAGGGAVDRRVEPARVDPKPDTAEGSRRTALVVAGAALLLVLVLAAAVAIVPRGRARSWRAADR
ncbi:S8 family serine peptidase [Streptomyces sp. NPDC058579]|uniref:S8 family serine peptidase n=1 Tax=Streptomyces sp. NPDC058579 TaxID=3346548 RepID=UPI003669EAF5